MNDASWASAAGHYDQVAARIREDLRQNPLHHQGKAGLIDEYIDFVSSRRGTAIARDGGDQHITASCFVFNPALDQVLLCFHKKGQFWVQLGGHIEPDDITIAAAALREAREESGLDELEIVTSRPLDVNRHALGDGFTMQCSLGYRLRHNAPTGRIRPSAKKANTSVGGPSPRSRRTPPQTSRTASTQYETRCLAEPS
ncbi:NUDIX domain-containing protein [Leifsonia aquatica]|uniref:NUDIX domain-containing protein n=1 Tax=Leifsonia aquatica TaxID=144185 RepID=UPI00384DADB3